MKFVKPIRRIIANLIDFVVLLILFLFVSDIYKFTDILDISSFTNFINSINTKLGFYYCITIFILYFFMQVLLPTLDNGYTIGGLILNTKIMKLNEKKMTIGTMIIREILGGIVLNTFSFGIILIISIVFLFKTKGNRTIYDRLANTIVVEGERKYATRNKEAN